MRNENKGQKYEIKENKSKLKNTALTCACIFVSIHGQDKSKITTFEKLLSTAKCKAVQPSYKSYVTFKKEKRKKKKKDKKRLKNQIK